jgi:hypothetical protein
MGSPPARARTSSPLAAALATGPLSSGIHDLRLALVALGLLAARALFILARPTRDCPRCHGTGMDTKGGRARPCKRHGCIDGHIYRFGATAVHRFWWSAVAGPRIEKRREAIKTAREQQGSK